MGPILAMQWWLGNRYSSNSESRERTDMENHGEWATALEKGMNNESYIENYDIMISLYIYTRKWEKWDASLVDVGLWTLQWKILPSLSTCRNSVKPVTSLFSCDLPIEDPHNFSVMSSQLVDPRYDTTRSGGLARRSRVVFTLTKVDHRSLSFFELNILSSKPTGLRYLYT